MHACMGVYTNVCRLGTWPLPPNRGLVLLCAPSGSTHSHSHSSARSHTHMCPVAVHQLSSVLCVGQHGAVCALAECVVLVCLRVCHMVCRHGVLSPTWTRVCLSCVRVPVVSMEACGVDGMLPGGAGAVHGQGHAQSQPLPHQVSCQGRTHTSLCTHAGVLQRPALQFVLLRVCASVCVSRVCASVRVGVDRVPTGP